MDCKCAGREYCKGTSTARQCNVEEERKIKNNFYFFREIIDFIM
jgi:hypothetical protein